MTGIFRANNPYNSFLLIIYALVLKAGHLVSISMPLETAADGTLYKFIVTSIRLSGSASGHLFSIVAFVLVAMQAVFLNNMVLRSRYYSKQNYLAGMSFLLITSLFESWTQFSSVMLVNTLLIWILYRLNDMHLNNRSKSLIFNLGLVIGCAIFIYVPTIFFVLLVYFGISTSRAFRPNEWVICLLGVLTPVYFFASWLFLSNAFLQYKIMYLRFLTPVFPGDKLSIAAYILVVMAVLSGFFLLQANMRRQVVQVRKQWQVLFLFVLLGVATFFINSARDASFTMILAIPLAFYSGSAFFYPQKKWFPAVLHWSMFVVAIAVSYFGSYLS